MARFLGQVYLALRSLLLAIFSFFRPQHIPPIKHIPELNPILQQPAITIAQKIREGTYTSRQVVEAYIERIQQVNGHLNAAVAFRFTEALQEADLADAKIKEGKVDPKKTPFLGVPCSIKECMALTGMPNTSGLVARKKRGPATFDAAGVRRLRNAGFIPLCVTNTSELCMWYESSNNVYGRTNNPYDLRRMVGGSSGGEAALVGAAGAPVGLGSDIGGSIRMPAFFNGVWGLKPTGGTIPNDGQHPMAANEALLYMTTGPICRYAEDLWPLFTVLADPYFDQAPAGQEKGEKGASNTTATLPSPRAFPDPQAIDLSTLEFLSLYDLNNFMVQEVSQDLRNIQGKVEAHLQDSAGLKRKELAHGQLRFLRNAPDIWTASLAVAGGKSFSLLCGDEKREVSFLWELLKFPFGASQHTLMAIMLCGFERLPSLIAPGTVKEHYRQGKALKQELATILGKNGVLIFPSHPTVAPPHHAALFVPFNFAYTAILNILEIPVVQCPLGLDSQGIPVGVQIGALHGNEHVAVAVAHELQRAFGGWVAPPI